MPYNEDGISGAVKWFVAIAVFVFLLMTAVVTIGAGERGVVLEWGKPVGIFGEGLNFKIPIMQSVVVMNIRTLKYETKADAASKDLQDVYATVALNYHLDGSKVMETYRTIGDNAIVESTVIMPAVQEAVKASTARYNAEELIQERAVIKQTIEDSLTSRLESRGVYVETISITNFDFTPEYKKAIEAKQVAQQDALKAQNIYDKMKVEAEQVKVTAAGQANATLTMAMAEAQALEIQGKAIRENPDIIQLRMIEKWNGVVPVFSAGGNSEFILDISSLLPEQQTASNTDGNTWCSSTQPGCLPSEVYNSTG